MWLLIGLFEGKIIVMQETLLMIMCRSSAGSFLHSEKRDEKRLVCELRIVDGVWLLRLQYCVPSLEQFGCCRGQPALLRLQIARPGTVATHFQRSDVALAQAPPRCQPSREELINSGRNSPINKAWLRGLEG